MRITVQPGQPLEITFGQIAFRGWSACRIIAAGISAWIFLALLVMVRLAG